MENLKLSLSRPLKRTICIVSALIALTYVALCFFNYPSSDDYQFAYRVITRGIFGAVSFEYFNWGGRYTSAFILGFGPLPSYNFFGYKIWAVFNFLFLLFGLSYFTIRLSQYFNLRSQVTWLTLALVSTVYLSGFPGPNEGLYWMPGFVNYTFPVIFGLFAIWILLKYPPSEWSWKWCLIAFILTIVYVGFNETTMFLANAYFLSYLAYTLYQKRISKGEVTLTLGALIGGLAMLLAPGNQVRKSHFEPINPFYAAFKSIGSSLEHMPQFLSPALIFCFIILFIWSKENKLLFQHPVFKIKPWKSFLFLIFINALGFFPSQISMGGNPRSRVDNIFYSIFFIFLFFICIQWACQSQKKWAWLARRMSTKTQYRLSVILLLMSLPLNKNGTAIYDLFFKASAYKLEAEQRINIAQSSQGKDLVIEPIKVRPATLFFKDLPADQTDWRNEFFAKYYGLNSIKTSIDR